MAGFIKRALISALGVALGSWMLPGISYDSNGTLIVAVLLLGVFSAFIKPLLVLFTLPFVVLTLGLGVLLINALLFLLVGELVEGFFVDGFGYAFLGALIVSILNLFFTNWINGGRPYARVTVKRSFGPPNAGSNGARRQNPAQRRAFRNDDVIDI